MKEKIIAQLMKMTWDSLSSHLPYISENTNNSAIKDKKTQKKIVRDYISMLEMLGKLL